MASRQKSSAPRRAKGRARAARLKPSISIIGAGRLGTALALALAERGYAIDALVARRLSHARRAAKLVGTHTTRAVASDELRELPSSDLLIIATPDDAIETVAASLAAASGPAGGLRTALHASGALSSDVLKPLRAAGFHTGSLHPLVAVSDPAQGALNLREAFFCVEGDREAVHLARTLVRALGGQAFSIRARDKALYHAAAVMAAGHAVALFDVALEMLTKCGLKDDEAQDVLLPLTRSALAGLETQAPARALTGTFARTDAATVRRHLAALRSSDLPDAHAAYTLLGLRSLKLAAEAGANPGALREIELALFASEELKDGP